MSVWVFFMRIFSPYHHISPPLEVWGRTQNASLHFEGILKTRPTIVTPGGHSATKFTFKRGFQKV